MNPYWVRLIPTSAPVDGHFHGMVSSTAVMKAALTLFQRCPSSVSLMMGRRAFVACLALIGAMGLAAPALPQDVQAPCRLCDTSSTSIDDKPAAPISLDVEASLDFDQLILAGTGSGTAELGPDGTRLVTGAVTALSARAMVGEVTIRGEPGRQLRVDLPRNIELFGFNGGSIQIEFDPFRPSVGAAPRFERKAQFPIRRSHPRGGRYGRAVPRRLAIDVDYF